mgnify:CR=1 FL=1
MPAPIRRILRAFLALTLWVGVSVAAAWSPPVAAEVAASPDAGARPLWERLGDAGLCGDEEGADGEVLCGGELLLGLVARPSLLVMSASTCTLLLEEIYRRQLCDPSSQECERYRHSGLPPPGEGALAGGGASSLLPSAPALLALGRGDGLMAPRHGARVLLSIVLDPTTPPPRRSVG